MAAIAGWTKLIDSDYEAVRRALLLLQETFVDGQYDHLSVDDLRHKMQAQEPKPDQTHPSDPNRALLHLWSHGPVDDPTLSAFFFLRRNKKNSGSKEQPGYCMTVGAKPQPAGMDPNTLRTQIGVVCGSMRNLPSPWPLEVMHENPTPNFRDVHGNLATAYGMAIAPGAAVPRLDRKNHDIALDPPVWTDTSTTMPWWNVHEQ
jgi:hypothetical protein